MIFFFLHIFIKTVLIPLTVLIFPLFVAGLPRAW